MVRLCFSASTLPTACIILESDLYSLQFGRMGQYVLINFNNTSCSLFQFAFSTNCLVRVSFLLVCMHTIYAMTVVSLCSSLPSLVIVCPLQNIVTCMAR